MRKSAKHKERKRERDNPKVEYSRGLPLPPPGYTILPKVDFGMPLRRLERSDLVLYDNRAWMATGNPYYHSFNLWYARKNELINNA